MDQLVEARRLRQARAADRRVGHLHRLAGAAARHDASALPAAAQPRPWRRAALWLALLGAVLLSSPTASRTGSPRSAPTCRRSSSTGSARSRSWPGRSCPTGRSTLFYGLSLFVCATRRELDTHARRLLTAQLVAVTCFLAFPLRFTFDRPDVGGGLSGFLFDALLRLRQAVQPGAVAAHRAARDPVGALRAARPARGARRPLHAWFLLIGVSVLTT